MSAMCSGRLARIRSGVRFPKASLANYGGKSHWTLLVMTELATIVAFGKRTPDLKISALIYLIIPLFPNILNQTLVEALMHGYFLHTLCQPFIGHFLFFSM